MYTMHSDSFLSFKPWNKMFWFYINHEKTFFTKNFVVFFSTFPLKLFLSWLFFLLLNIRFRRHFLVRMLTWEVYKTLSNKKVKGAGKKNVLNQTIHPDSEIFFWRKVVFQRIRKLVHNFLSFSHKTLKINIKVYFLSRLEIWVRILSLISEFRHKNVRFKVRNEV